MEEMVILTGGTDTKNKDMDTEKKVTVYNTEGWVEDWPELQKGGEAPPRLRSLRQHGQPSGEAATFITLTIFTRADLTTMSRCTSWQGATLAPPTPTPLRPWSKGPLHGPTLDPSPVPWVDYRLSPLTTQSSLLVS